MEKSKKHIVFLTGTRADYGKIRSLMQKVKNSESFVLHIYVTGMHLLEEFGNTYKELEKDGFTEIFLNQRNHFSTMSERLGLEILQFSRYIQEIKPDLIIVHGDRLEALAGASAGALANIRVAHIEGGEVSGTIDESIRHAISKLAHFHFVANESAAQRLLQLGENKNNIFIIGSPDIDVMLKNELPSLEEVKSYYEIPFDSYSLLLYHPVTTLPDDMEMYAKIVIEAAKESGRNFIAIYPNNDLGSDIIIKLYKEQLVGHPSFCVYPSLRFESFLTLLKHCDCIYGNSSAGIREASVYGKPAIDVGIRQQNRYNAKILKNITPVAMDKSALVSALKDVRKRGLSDLNWGTGRSGEHFIEIISRDKFWETPLQKTFCDL